MGAGFNTSGTTLAIGDPSSTNVTDVLSVHELLSFSVSQVKTKIQITTMATSDSGQTNAFGHKYIPGKFVEREFSCTVDFDPTNLISTDAAALYEAGTSEVVTLTFADSDTSVWTCNGFLINHTVNGSGLDEHVTADMTFALTGLPSAGF